MFNSLASASLIMFSEVELCVLVLVQRWVWLYKRIRKWQSYPQQLQVKTGLHLWFDLSFSVVIHRNIRRLMNNAILLRQNPTSVLLSVSDQTKLTITK